MKQTAMLAVAAMLSLGSAMAAQYTDANPANVRLDANYLSGFNPLYNPSYTGGWDLLNEGYNPANETITSATATFKLNDANGGSESYTITIDGDAFAAGGSFSTSLFGTISVGGAIGVDALLTLDTTGLLSYTITATRGIFWLTEAKLVADATGRAQPSPIGVPDGGATLALLGFGLLGLLGASRRIA